MKISKLLPLLILPLSLQAAEPAPGKQVHQELRVGDQSVPYLLYLPADYGASDSKAPVMLFLHGRGESRGPLSIVAKWGPPKVAERGDDLPYILVSPQCPEKESWGQPGQQALLVKLLDHIASKYNADTNRVYLTGLSMGGYGSWRLAADHPDRFAAVVPICGGGNPEDASKLKDVPIWAWHGDKDTAVPLKRSVEMVEAIKAAGGDSIRLTVLEHIGHNSWEAAYATPELYDWLNKHKTPRKDP